MIELEKVACKICGEETTFTSTRLCNRCWELEKRIHRDPELAWRMLEDFEKEKSEDFKRKQEVIKEITKVRE